MKDTENRDKNKDKARSKKSPAQSKDRTDENRDFPGYPPYPPQEDIMNKSTKTERVEGDIQNTNRAGRGLTENREHQGENQTFQEDQVAEGAETEYRNELTGIDPESNLTASEEGRKSEFDVTGEDIEALGPKDLSMDMGEDEQLLKHRPWPVDFTGKELDVPGEEPVRHDALEQGDEENDHYSLGGDRHEDLEDDPNASSRENEFT